MWFLPHVKQKNTRFSAVKLLENTCHTSASAVVIHYKEALYQVYAPLPFTFQTPLVRRERKDIPPVKTRCWFVGGDDLTGALHVL